MKLFFLLLVIFFVSNVNGQQNFYLYIQNENAKPFYVKYKSKVFSSTTNGYLILSKLLNGKQDLKIGFPKSQEQEIYFQINIQNEDMGYKLKQINGKLILYNFRDRSILNEFNEIIIPNKSNEIVKTNENVKIEKSDQQKEEVLNKNETIDNKTKDLIINTSLNTDFPKSKIIENNTGVEAIYYLKEGEIIDTIKIFVPVYKNLNKTEVIEINKNLGDTLKKEESLFLEFEVKNNIDNKEGEQKKEKKIDSSITQKKVILFNSDCKKIATNEDYLLLRKKLAGMENIDDMFTTSLKVLKQKCFTVEQIRKTSVLFFNDDEKFTFFKITYPYIYNSESFPTLISELKDNKSIQNFNLLIKK